MQLTDLQPLTKQALCSDKEPTPLIIAGPCSAESLEQTLSTAVALAKIGVTIFRAGIWKPRTKPGGFEGVGAEGLAWLKAVKQQTGMSIATEVATPAHVEEALKHEVDIVWIGARTSTNPFAVQEIADSLRGVDVGVMVKNPVNPDINLWLGALERIYAAGIRKLAAVHRGFASYYENTYRNTPQWTIPIELRRLQPELPIICDPSHISGRRDLIAPLARQAMDMGFDGVMVETHIDPDKALSDSNQQITPEQLRSIIATLHLRECGQLVETLSDFRSQIDKIDYELLDILARRMDVSRRIGDYKRDNNISILQPKRYDEIIAQRVAYAEQRGIDAEFVRKLLEEIHEESIIEQLKILNKE